jgi:hypothetical protein
LIGKRCLGFPQPTFPSSCFLRFIFKSDSRRLNGIDYLPLLTNIMDFVCLKLRTHLRFLIGSFLMAGLHPYAPSTKAILTLFKELVPENYRRNQSLVPLIKGNQQRRHTTNSNSNSWGAHYHPSVLRMRQNIEVFYRPRSKAHTISGLFRTCSNTRSSNMHSIGTNQLSLRHTIADPYRVHAYVRFKVGRSAQTSACLYVRRPNLNGSE